MILINFLRVATKKFDAKVANLAYLFTIIFTVASFSIHCLNAVI